MTHQKRVEKGLYWDRAWSLVEGCTPVSEGCRNCWAAEMAWMRRNHPNEKIAAANRGLAECPMPLKNVRCRDFATPPRFTGLVRVRPDLLTLPASIKQPTIFSVWTDLFHESVPGDFIIEAFMAMRVCPQHTFLILTKRAELMYERITMGWSASFARAVLTKNVWLGVTVESQKHLARLSCLREIPNAKLFISVEPMLELIMLGHYRHRLGWVICGPETGPLRRPFEAAWAKSLLAECLERPVPVPFFDKSVAPLRRELPWVKA